ncbi:uncharacterized protein [Miscanthus floridulus]|uniref:uncharacterized protein n=1 Tax=Miscanthus floridulus TaxID=154761 RepID=UPI003459474F
MAAAPALLHDLVEEFLLRLPPADPAILVHAALVSKPWYRIISDPRFRRRFREFHRAAAMLGFFCTLSDDLFIPTPPPLSARPTPATSARWTPATAASSSSRWKTWTNASSSSDVWDPTTDERWEVREPVPLPDVWDPTSARPHTWDCDYHDCHGKPFIVVYVGPSIERELMPLHVYSSEADSWSQLTSVPNCCVDEEL